MTEEGNWIYSTSPLSQVTPSQVTVESLLSTHGLYRTSFSPYSATVHLISLSIVLSYYRIIVLLYYLILNSSTLCYFVIVQMSKIKCCNWDWILCNMLISTQEEYKDRIIIRNKRRVHIFRKQLYTSALLYSIIIITAKLS